MLIAALLLAGLTIVADAAAVTPTPSPAETGLPDPSEGRNCVGSTLSLADTFPIAGKAGPEDIVDIRRFFMNSAIGPPFLAGWLYIEKNGNEYFESNGAMTQAERSLLLDALRDSDLSGEASFFEKNRGTGVATSLQSDDRKAKYTAFFAKHGALRGCFTKPLSR